MKWRWGASLPEEGHPPDRRWCGHQAHLNAVEKRPSARKWNFPPYLVSPQPNRYSDQRASAPPQVRVPTRSWFSRLNRIMPHQWQMSSYIQKQRHRAVLPPELPAPSPKVLQIAALARDVTEERAPTFNGWVTTFQVGSSVKVFPAIKRYASQPVQSRSLVFPIMPPHFKRLHPSARATTLRKPSHLTLVLPQIPRIRTVL